MAIDISVIERVIDDQQSELALYSDDKRNYINRDGVDRKLLLKSEMVQVITGIRRCGKSTLAHLLLKNLKYAYLNFDDERLSNITHHDLANIFEVLLSKYGPTQYLFFDEIQNIQKFELFLNRLKRKNYHIIITGSNAEMLSRELADRLTGRHLIYTLFPFSFKEYLIYNSVDVSNRLDTEERAKLFRLMKDYCRDGGFAETYLEPRKNQYLQSLYTTILMKDIVGRYSLKYPKHLKELAFYLMNNIGTKLSYNNLTKLFDFKSAHTIKNYLEYLEETYLFYQVLPFSKRIKHIIKRPKKIYAIDHAMIQAICSSACDNISLLMENIICIELLRRGNEVFYYDENGKEVDFIAKKDGECLIIQVAYSIADQTTKNREVDGALQAAESLKRNKAFIITWAEEGSVNLNGVEIIIIPLWKWLLLTNA